MFTLSIIVPCHNVVEKLAPLLSCLESIDRPDVELILVDDASSDATADLLAEARRNLKIPVAIHSGGYFSPGSARNAGVALARGEYVWFVDADDMIRPGPVFSRLEAMVSERADLYAFRVQEYSGRVSGFEHGSDPFENWTRFGRVGGKVIRKDLLREKQLQYPPASSGEDTAFVLRLSLAIRDWRSIDEIIYEVVPAPNSIGRSSSFNPRWFTRWLATRDMVDTVNTVIPVELRSRFYDRLVYQSISQSWAHHIDHGRFLSLIARLPFLLALTRSLGLAAHLGIFLNSGSLKNRLVKRVLTAAAMPLSSIMTI